MANKVLEASVRLDTKSAVSSLDKLERKIKAVNKAVEKTSTGNNQLNKAITKAVTATNKLDSATKKVATTTQKVANTANKVNTANEKAANSARKMRDGYNSSNTAASRLLSTMRSLASTYLGIMGAKVALTGADTVTSAENRLNNLEGGNTKLTQESMDKMYGAAQRSRSGYGDMLNNVSKTMTLAGDSFNNNIDNAIKFQEIMSKAYTVGGASAAEQASSMYQLVQALGSGILQGDELRSVREGAPIAYKKIEEFAQGVFDTEMSLKEMASQGVITSDIVVAAIMNAEKDINKSFENTEMTFAQAWTSIKNMALQAFKPVLQMLNDALNSSTGQSIINGIGQAFLFLADVILWVGNAVGTVINWIIENWSWLKYIVIFALSVIAAYFIYTGTVAVVTAIQSAIAWLAVHWQLALCIVVIGLLVAAIVWLANTTSSGAEFMIKALLLVGLAIALIGVITGSTAIMIIGVVVMVVAGIVALLAYCGEEVMSIVYQVGAFIYNLIVGFINQAIQVLFALIDPILGLVEWIYNAFNDGFNGIGGACANLVGQMISWFLSLGKVVTKIIDAIFGTDWTSELNSLQEKVLAWGKNEEALTINREAPTVQSIAGKFGLDLPDRIAYDDAGSAGADLGVKIEKGLASFGDSIQNKIAGVDDFGNLIGGLGKFTEDGYVTDPAHLLDDAYDPSAIDDDIAKGLKELGNIEDDTNSIKDAMDLSNDDLDYLRKIADMEWRNEFTTASIKVDMTNNNTVNGERDLDGIVEYLSDVLRAEMTNVAYGTHY